MIIRIIRIVKTKIVISKGMSINKSLNKHEKRQRHETKTRMAVDKFINIGNIYSLMGWGIRIITVV